MGTGLVSWRGIGPFPECFFMSGMLALGANYIPAYPRFDKAALRLYHARN